MAASGPCRKPNAVGRPPRPSRRLFRRLRAQHRRRCRTPGVTTRSRRPHLSVTAVPARQLAGSPRWSSSRSPPVECDHGGRQAVAAIPPSKALPAYRTPRRAFPMSATRPSESGTRSPERAALHLGGRCTPQVGILRPRNGWRPLEAMASMSSAEVQAAAMPHVLSSHGRRAPAERRRPPRIRHRHQFPRRRPLDNLCWCSVRDSRSRSFPKPSVRSGRG